MPSLEQWMGSGSGLAPRAARRSRASVRERLARLRQRTFFIVQCALAAAIAWWAAHGLLGHQTPFFAPVVAVICLGMSFGQRLRRAIEVTIGAAVGVLIGDLFVHAFGSGYWQIGVVAMVSMSLAVLLGAGTLLVTQAGVQAIVITTLVARPGQALDRWLDAVVGGVIALLMATVAPAAPVRRPRQQAAAVVAELAAILEATAEAMRRGDADLARETLERARRSEDALAELRSLSAEGIAVVRLSPFRRRALPGVQAIADIVEPLDRAIRNVRVLVRRAATAAWRQEQMPAGYIDMIAALARVTGDIGAELQLRRLPTEARDPLSAIARASTQVAPDPTLSGETIRAQVRSTVVDLLMLTGLTYDEALTRVPASGQLPEELFDEGGE